MPTALQDSWVDQLFGRLSIRYGNSWTSMWAGLDAAMVKADWAQELAGASAHAIKFGIANLPLDRPPNAAQFREICKRAPALQAPLIGHDRPEPNLERLEHEFRRLGDLQRERNGDPKAWARRLRDAENAGEHLSMRQRQAWRTALLYDDGRAPGGVFVAPPREALPPGGLRAEP